MGFDVQSGKKPKYIKEFNTRLVLSIFRGQSVTTVAAVSEMTGLSKTTISKIFNWMSDNAIIMPTGQGPSTTEGGKKPVLFALNPDYCYSILLSAGFADRIYCTVYNFVEEGIWEQSAALPPDATYDQALETAADLIMRAIQDDKVVRSRIAGIAILYDGIVDYRNGVILDSVHHNWGRGLPICADLAARLPITAARIIVDNATHFSGYSEAVLRKHETQDKMIITWDENRMLGWSLLSRNELMNNDGGISGTFSHIILDTTTPRVCRCGARGCLEVLLSLEALGDYIRDNRDRYPDSELLYRYDRGEFEIRDIFSGAREGDRLAYDLMVRIAGYFTTLVRNVFNLFGQQKIVFQGMFSLSGDLFLEVLREKLLQFNILHLFNEDDISLVYSRYSYGQKEEGKNPYLKGAAMLLSDMFIDDYGKNLVLKK